MPLAARSLFFTTGAGARANFHLRIEHIRIRSRDVQTDTPEQSFRQSTAFELLPGLAGIDRFPDSAPGPPPLNPKLVRRR